MDTKIFSGKSSNMLWKEIDKVYKQKKRKKIAKVAGMAIYSLGCRCQELEHEVDTLRQLVHSLKKKLETPKQQ